MQSCHNCHIETNRRMYSLCVDCVMDYTARRRQEGISTTQIIRELKRGVKRW